MTDRQKPAQVQIRQNPELRRGIECKIHPLTKTLKFAIDTYLERKLILLTMECYWVYQSHTTATTQPRVVG